MQPTVTAQKRTTQDHDYLFLDGLRGLAAMNVLLAHIFALAIGYDSGILTSLPAGLLWVARLLPYKHFTVTVFIVLSGYCLMLPVARSAEGRMRGGFWPYLKRRARRILPPYYAALLLSVGLGWLANIVKHHAGMAQGTYLSQGDMMYARSLSAGSVLSHLVLLHNMTPEWNRSIDSPTWSVATEWQIYFLFPLVLLPVWRRLGLIPLLLTAWVIGMLPHLLLPQARNFDWSCPWFLGLFAMGMAGAVITLSPDAGSRRWFRLPWQWIALAFAAAFCALAVAKPNWIYFGSRLWILDALMGVCTVGVILYCAQPVQNDMRRFTVKTLLEARPALFLGTFSYSIYLVHWPIADKLPPAFGMLNLTPLELLVGSYAVGVPVVLCCAYLFFIVFERPFLSNRRRETLAQLAQDTVDEPAP